MFDTIYIEKEARQHPRTLETLARYPNATLIDIDRYGEVFNRRSQNFRLQKHNPSLIIAHKHGQRVLPTPEGYGVGQKRNYYFSHLLNCLYDCRYCFLQGMFRSAHFVWFVNYEDFIVDIKKTAQQDATDAMFFSGYDCDSLALDSLTSFSDVFIEAFKTIPNACLELRTKSINVGALLKTRPFPQAVVAFSLSPQKISTAFEHKVPSLQSRLKAMQALAQKGWNLGLRFDPIIYSSHMQDDYLQLLKEVKALVPARHIHSISLGPLRFPKKMHDSIARLYPKSPLFSGPLEKRSTMMSYPIKLEESMMDFISDQIRIHWPDSKIFQCLPESF